ncbi:hypothetical protein BDP55DRAFT_656531 [Colletotrichum godetiae]|uniref:Uncharacterized protein n=1 Tax=Colletotrichum godetiae TaxID=1209918 RepID=A0AAJ0AQR2_9PEZI|nr:uncharacterized protein BDP55DRAFT_656531 [Colletotrichum godetiae]KAK1688623.1 hypothetical protein BDP55DRAFT_656531 [Colletotrichum godetiae]
MPPETPPVFQAVFTCGSSHGSGRFWISENESTVSTQKPPSLLRPPQSKPRS